MNTKLLFTLLGFWLIQSVSAQIPAGFTSSTIEATLNATEQQAAAFFRQQHPNATEADFREFISSLRAHPHATSADRTAVPNTPQASCTNIDFEQGSLAGWTQSTGYNPGYNAIGCCASPGGAQTIVSGTGVDPCGGFPVVAPGGSFSVKLGDNNTGGIADRLEQTFQVTAANTNFTYAYAVVLEDPGHALSDQPGFQIEMVDGSGNQIPCTFYQVSAGQGIPGFQSSTNCAGVIYKPWTTVSVDLTNYIGQNITIRFTTYDCALGGHYGYAYIDGGCSSFQISQTGVLCNNSSASLCAPAGYASYSWNGPGISNLTGQCITVSSAGTYNVLCTSVTGCSSPMIQYSINNNAAPNANFNPSNVVGCNAFVGFNNTSSFGGGTYTNFWTFGDGDTSSQLSPSHTYPAYGTYTVNLYVTAQNGCSDTSTQTVTINPPPVPGMSYTASCEGVTAQFSGSLSGNTQGATWLWNFGNGNTSSLQNPTYTFPTWGAFPVTLSVTNNGCTTTITQNINIAPNPIVAFSANNICFGTATSFTNTSYVPGSAAISSWAWDFDGDGNTDNSSQNPSWTFPSAGTVVVSLSATSASGCIATQTANVTVYGMPTSFFTTQNNCLATSTTYTNASTAPAGSYITNYFWNFGDGNFSTLQQPVHTYATASTYTVRLDVTTNNTCMSSYQTPVTVYALPVVAFTSSQQCENQITQFNGTCNGLTTNASWNWNFGSSSATIPNPTHAFTTYGTYPVTLIATDNNNCSSSVTQSVVIQPIPVINVTANTVCFGNSTLFNNNSTIPSGSITGWSWDFNNDGTIDNTAMSPTYNFAASGNYSVNVSATSNNGCVATAVVPVQVNALPNASFITTNNCFHATSVFGNTSSAPAGTTLTQYNWSFGNGGSSSAQTGQITYSAPGVYPVSLTVGTNQGCVATFTAPITIYPVPTANFNAPSVCANQNMQFTDQSFISSGSINSYNWDFDMNGTTDANSQNAVNTYTAGGTHYAELVVVSGFGCRDSVTKPVNVYFNPVANFVTQSVCLGSTSQFLDASTCNSGTITSWAWDFTSDNIVDNVTKNPTHTYTTAGQILVTLQVQSNYGCQNVIQKSFRVNPTPVVSFAVSQQSGCQGNMCVGMINNSTITGGSVAGWQWGFGDGSSSGQNSPVHCFVNAGTFNVTLTAVSDSGCTAQHTMTNAVTVYPKPVAGFDFTNPNPDVLDASTGITSTAMNATTYTYYLSDGTISHQAGFQHTFTSQDPASYTVIQIVSSAHGCKDTIVKTIEIKQGFTFYIPNAFSPNGDGSNDVFKGTGIGIKKYTLMIYDRWGNLVFESDDLERGWDGTYHGDQVSLEDVFVWKVRLKDETDNPHDYAGTVSLIK